jgi:hypothetical protein
MWCLSVNLASFFVTVFIVIVAVILAGRGDRDDTDPPDGRSGLSLYTDSKTGCQYLRAGISGLTPRLDRDGKQICLSTQAR